MSLGTIAGKLIKTAAGKLAASCECCRLCVYACYCHPAGWTVGSSPCPELPPFSCCSGVPPAQCGRILATVAVPKPVVFFGTAVEVTITGSFDDDIAIDGVPTRECVPAATVFHQFVMAAGDNSFDLGAVDNFGACAGGDIKICFAPCSLGPPTITVSGTSGSGTGAKFNVTLAKYQNSSGLDRWSVSNVTRSGGAGYANGDALTFSIAEGDTQEVAAAAAFNASTHTGPAYSAPTLTATATGGAGAVLSINGYTQLLDGYYIPTGITVVSGGTGYTNNSPVTLFRGPDDEWAPGSGSPNITIRTAFDPPGDDWTLTAYSADGMDLSAGVGLALSIALTPIPGYGDEVFEATAVTIADGGTGYQVGEFILATVLPDGDFGETGLTITGVDQYGAVTGLSLDFPGQHQGVDTGVISSVVISSHRPARKAITFTGEVSISNGGVYYRLCENPFP